VSFLLLAILAWRGPSFAAAAYVAMQPIAELVILPLCLAALITGVVQALGTAWGLTRHYWVLAKLMLTLITLVVLCLQLRTIDLLAASAGAREVSLLATEPRLSVMLHATGGLVVLALALILSIVKPPGRTPWASRPE